MTHGAGSPWNAAAAALPFPIWVYDADHRLVAANDAAIAGQGLHTDLLQPGTPLADVLRALAFRGVLGPGDPAALVERHLAVDRARAWKRLVRDRDGTCREMHGAPLAGGGSVVTAFDVTAAFALVEEAQARARQLDLVLAQLQRGVAVFDAQSRIVVHNPAYEDLLGLPRGHVRLGTTREALVRGIAARGSFLLLEDPETLEARVAPRRSHPDHFERERSDGVVIAVSTQAMPGGGYVAELADITALRRAEQQAAHRAALLDGVVEALPHGVVTTTPDGHIAMVNAAHREIMGEAAARVGEHRDAVALRRARLGEYGPGDPEALATYHLRQAEQRIALRRRRPDGRSIDLRFAPLPGGGHISVVTDITALEAAQREAQERSTLLQLMLDNMRHGIALFGPDRRLVAANPLAERLLGLAPGQLRIGRSFDEMVAEQLALGEVDQRAHASYGQADRSQPFAYVRTSRSGAVLEVISDPTPDGGFVVTYSDITARRTAEHHAAERAATLQAMLDRSRHGIAMYDASARLVAANALFADATSIPPERVVPGTPYADLLALRAAYGGFGDDPAVAAEAVARLLAIDRRQSRRDQRRLPDGRVIEIASDPTPDGGWIATYNDVTALAQAEAEARARATLLATTLDHINHSIVLYDADRRVVLANRLAGALHGLPGIEARQGVAIDTLIDEQRDNGFFGEGDAARRLAEEVKRLDRRRTLRYQRTLPDGRVIAIASDPTPDGGFVVTNSDITALRRAEAEAQMRADVLAVMLDNMRHGICLFDASGRVVAANALASAMTGLGPLQLAPGVTVADLARAQRDSGEFPEAGDWRDDPTAGAAPLRLDAYRRQRPDGTVIEVATAATPNGGFVRTFTDVTRLAAAEAEARHRADIQQAMLDNIRHGILLVDAEGRIVAANPMLRKMLELPEAVVAPGRTYESFIRSMHASGELGEEPAATTQLRDILGFDRRVPRRIERTRPNGESLEVISDPTPDGGFIISFSDITEQRRVRAELERARDAAEAADRAKSRFLATMSHELRTPLNAVIGFSEAIRADPTADRRDEYLGAIQEAGRHLLGLIDDILDVARTETSGLQLQESATDLGLVAAAALRMMGATATAGGIALQSTLPDNLPAVRADALRIRQILLNLLSNAVKFTPPGGLVRIGAMLQPDGGLEVTVRDTGIGITAADIPRAFEPFVQIDSALSRRFPGSGLGLYLSRALAAAHDAELVLDSTPGVGTTARLRFPAERLLAPPAPAAAMLPSGAGQPLPPAAATALS